MCKESAREKKGADCGGTDRPLRAPATPFSFPFSLLPLFISSPSVETQNTFTLFASDSGRFPFQSSSNLFSRLLLSLNTIACIFHNSPLSIFPITRDEWREKAYNIQPIDPRPSLQKKSRFRGWGNGGGLDTAIDNLLYQPFPWQPARARTEGCHAFCTCLFHIPIVIMKVSWKQMQRGRGAPAQRQLPQLKKLHKG